MYLVISPDVFCDENNLHLNEILRQALDNMMFVKLDGTNDGQFKKWLGGLGKDIKFKWENVLKTSIKDLSKHRIAKEVKVSATITESDWDSTPPVLNPSDAIDLISQPKKIILENSRSDRKFLLSMADEKLRTRLLELERRGRLQFVNAGGIGELKKQLKEAHIPIPGSRFVCWVLFDSDAASPGHVSEAAKAVAEVCIDFNIDYHCLKRRAIENYVPKKAMLDAIADHTFGSDFKELMDAFFVLTEEQRHYFHLKEGLRNSSCRDSGNYDQNDKNVKKLQNGFGDRLAGLYPDDISKMKVMHQYLDEVKATTELLNSINVLKAMIRSPQ